MGSCGQRTAVPQDTGPTDQRHPGIGELKSWRSGVNALSHELPRSPAAVTRQLLPGQDVVRTGRGPQAADSRHAARRGFPTVSERIHLIAEPATYSGCRVQSPCGQRVRRVEPGQTAAQFLPAASSRCVRRGPGGRQHRTRSRCVDLHSAMVPVGHATARQEQGGYEQEMRLCAPIPGSWCLIVSLLGPGPQQCQANQARSIL